MTELLAATQAWFARIDSDNSKSIDPQELRAEFIRLSLQTSEADNMMTFYDTNGDKILDAKEFAAALIDILDNSIPGFQVFFSSP